MNKRYRAQTKDSIHFFKTQPELAKFLGVSERTVREYLKVGAYRGCLIGHSNVDGTFSTDQDRPKSTGGYSKEPQNLKQAQEMIHKLTRDLVRERIRVRELTEASQ